MTSHQDPGTGSAPRLGQPQRVRFLTLRVNPSRPAQTQGPNSRLHPSTPSDQQEPQTVNPVNPTRHNPAPAPRTHSPATATAPNPAGPNTQATPHDFIADPSTDSAAAPLTGRSYKPCSPPPRSRPAAYDHSPAAGAGRPPRRDQRRSGQTTQETAKTDTSTDQATPIVVRVPAQLPVLTKQVSRALLVLITELTEIEVLDRSPGGKEIT